MLKNTLLKPVVVLILVILAFIAVSPTTADNSIIPFKPASATEEFYPHYVAPGVKLVAVDNLSKDTMQYTYVLENITKNSPQLKNISKDLKAAFIEGIKNGDEAKAAALRESKVNLIFVYKDIKNIQLFRVVLNHGEY